MIYLKIKGPEAILREAAIDFGLVKIANTSKSFITIDNISSLPLKWHLRCLENEVYFYIYIFNFFIVL